MKSIVEQLRFHEGVRKAAYKDHLGYLTIGVGRLIDERKGGGLSDEEIDYLLANDIRKRQDALNKAIPWWENLTPVRQKVLLDMSFQMGVDGLLGFKNTLAKVKAGDYKGAAAGMLGSLWAKQTPERAQRLAKMMETGEDYG